MGTEVKIICGLTENVSSVLLLKPQIAENGKNYFLGHFWKCHSETLSKIGHCVGWTCSMISPFGAMLNILFLCPGTHKLCFFKHSAMQICCCVSVVMARLCSWSDLIALFLLWTYVFNTGWENYSILRPILPGPSISQCWQRRTSQVLYSGDVTTAYCPGWGSYETMAPTPLLLFSGVGPAVAREEGWHWKGSCSPLVIDLGVLQR